MNKKILSAFAAVCLMLLGAILGSTVTFGALEQHNSAPAWWYSTDAKQAFGLDTSCAPQVVVDGTIYSGATTNVSMTNAYTLLIKRGVIVGVNP